MPCNCRHGTGSHDHLQDGFLHGGVFGVGTPLNVQIDLSFIQLWNAKQSNSEAVRILDPNNANNEEPVCSDADPELLLFIPLRQVCRIKGISILGTNDDFSPSQVKVFCNPGIIQGFDSVRNMEPQEEIQLAQLPIGDRIVYRLNAAKFSSSSNLALLFKESFGEDETHLLRIDLFGESTGRPVHQELATNIVYEAMANPADHDVSEEHGKTFVVQ
ncbi:PITH domain [Trypanosoma melophagium]|uniref:PITH domain n=1 Tax=Trypanosoma melophagium TaxID=715481 RepID=UPI00351A454D|nr:PITH domain [Trypanosoma melophagium]